MAALENKRLQYFLDMIKKYEQKKKKKPTIRTPTHSKDDSATKKQLKTRKNSNSERTLIGSF